MCAHHPSLCELEVLRDFLTRGFGFNKTKAYANGAPVPALQSAPSVTSRDGQSSVCCASSESLLDGQNESKSIKATVELRTVEL